MDGGERGGGRNRNFRTYSVVTVYLYIISVLCMPMELN